jgi:membrane dipeptidase
MSQKAIDLHCDSVFSLMEGKDLRQEVPGVHLDLPRMRKGGVGLQVFAVYVPPESGEAFRFTMERLDAIDAFARSHELLAPVETAAELKKVLAAEKTGVMLAIENGQAIEDSLEKLEELRRRKVRIMTLVHSRHLSWIASCTGTEPFSEGTKHGLSRFGEKVVDAMNDLAIIPDVSHASENAFWDVIRRSKKPVIASHSCAYSLCASVRNLKDDQLKALGDSGGMVGVNFFSGFLSEPYRRQFDELIKNDPSMASWMVLNKEPPGISVEVPMSVIADHIDHIIKIAGEDCAGLGSDFDGIPAAPQGVTGSDFYPLLETELRSRGYSEKRIEKIFHGNFLRVLEEWD